LKQQQKMTALYCRLSKDDGGDAESNSIGTQRMMLQKYAEDHGLSIFDEYVDDGFTGTNFDRPNFNRMIQDIRSKKIGTVLVKDLSRLGRNNALVAYYTEIFFVDYDVRFVAINDGIDTDKGDNEIMPFKSVINEYYARDISKKVRSAKRTRAQNGEFLAGLSPLGYLKDPNDKHRLIVDEMGAKTVRYIFGLAVSGFGTSRIARQLNDEGVPTCREYACQISNFFSEGYAPKFPPVWTAASVRYILQNRTYLGSVVNGRSTTKSFKNRQRVYLPEDARIVVADKHPPLVSEDTFELAQRVIQVKQRVNMSKQENIFVGLLKCSDCDSNLSYASRKNTNGGGMFICSRYRTRAARKGLCTMHYIAYGELYEAVLQHIRQYAQEAKAYEDNFREYAEKLCCENGDKILRQDYREMERLTKRCNELNTVVQKLFEGYALGKISYEQFSALSAGYETEQGKINPKIDELQRQLTKEQNKTRDIEKFLNMIKNYIDIPELNRGILNELVEKIVVHTGEGRAPNRTQRLDIHYRFVGAFTADAPAVKYRYI